MKRKLWDSDDLRDLELELEDEKENSWTQFNNHLLDRTRTMVTTIKNLAHNKTIAGFKVPWTKKNQNGPTVEGVLKSLEQHFSDHLILTYKKPHFKPFKRFRSFNQIGHHKHKIPFNF